MSHWGEFVQEAYARGLIGASGKHFQRFRLHLPERFVITVAPEPRAIFELIRFAKVSFGFHEELLSLRAHYYEFVRSDPHDINFRIPEQCECGSAHISIRHWLTENGMDVSKL